jgi:polygalacturonase
MARLFDTGIFSVNATNGSVGVGYKLYFYTTGTSTPKATYPTRADAIAGTNANANPMVAASDGRWEPIWLTGGDYKAILKDFDDVTLETRDPADSNDESNLSASSGSSLVGFIQSGSGAVARTVQAKLRDVVSVKDFGAVGDGVTDDTTAVSNALATGREVFFPAGTYNITPATLSGFLSLKIRGAGRDVTKITLTSTGTALKFSNCSWLQISDLSIQATGTAQTLANAIGIQLDTGSSNAVLERINFYGFSLDGLRMVGTSGAPLSGHVVRQCYFLGCGRYQFYNEYNNDFTIDDNQFGMLSGITHAQIGCYLNASSAGTYTKNKHWENAIGLKALNSNFNSYVDNRIEINDNEGVYFDGCTDILFDSNRVYSNSATTDGASDNVYMVNCDRITFVGNNIFTWDASYSRWGVNFDTGCGDIVLGKNTIRGFDTTNFGPIRLVGPLDDISADLLVHGTATGVAAGATVYMSSGANCRGGGLCAAEPQICSGKDLHRISRCAGGR